ncbi:pyruvate/ketoisovalerate oxidoreductase, gamma subunit [Hydrogenobacter thermophilus TK-6]|uniref:2-oxoglutarate:ferredoxin oxidoreductase gamma subunit n=2 Tax=Hydrogenobacter thermophilus TaxID=940 RepID=D3DIA3_HYDTT|nr:2-oxoacid:acceptor oxidoreductase family protein [Hydrogenobacter thermophilus]ADO45482.1 pyruvate/ketoisovalerate oxidoreductase, gamma subunit [Hydrogenobacter thermophilus TK-6]BAB62135.1 subunit of 2-oxoglutarate:ferredoxin oxidoredutase [Hydrogenobacter thermophilus TK-6]BAI69555.1 2-oxoglutarate:ferredoxin oxidoreductase gamma subunit [Hydrogenobacter thermophilus TK-6]
MKRYNIRIAGVGGQGVVTSAHILGNAMSAAGKYATLVPFFGSEKRMAPVEAYVRVSDQPIYEVGEVVYPNVIMIYHPQVITHGKSYTMPFYSGLKENGLVIINTDADIIPEEDWKILNDLNTRVHMFPATKLALEIAGTELATNMAMIGLFFGITKLVGFEHIEQAVRERFLGNTFVASGGTTALDSAIEKKFKKKMELLEKNMQVIREAFKIAEERGWVEEEAYTS